MENYNATEQFLNDLFIEMGSATCKVLRIVTIKTFKEKSKTFAMTINGIVDDWKYERKPSNEKVIGFRFVYVCQRKGHLGDEVFGYKLIPIGEDKYLQVSFNC